jgi:hypothetical protein
MLFLVVVVSVAVLWVLARIRFPERVPTPNPVAPVLAQLAPPSPLESIADTAARLGAQLDRSVIAVEAQPRGDVLGGLHFRDDLALVVAGTAGADALMSRDPAIACDRPTTLCVVPVRGGAMPALFTWSPRGTESPRFLFAAAVSRRGVSWRPIFISALYPTRSALWTDSIWALPAAETLQGGTLVFTAEGAFAGVAIDRDGRAAIVPADTVLQAAGRLIAAGKKPTGYVGIGVQALTPELAAATGSASGVVVSWVDPSGPATGQLRATDIVEQIDGQPVTALESWVGRIDRLSVGDTVTFAIKRSGEVRTMAVTAAAEPAHGDGAELGLGLKSIKGTGAEITRVAAGSAAARAGLSAGDVITMAGEFPAPTAAQVARMYAGLKEGGSVIVAVTRADAHRIVVLARTK